MGKMVISVKHPLSLARLYLVIYFLLYFYRFYDVGYRIYLQRTKLYILIFLRVQNEIYQYLGVQSEYIYVYIYIDIHASCEQN